MIFINLSLMKEILSRGAEAKIEVIDENTLEKIREEKPYRNSLLDFELRNFRVKREFKVLNKLFELDVLVPQVFSLDKKNCSFKFEYLHGNVLKDTINEELLEKAFYQIIKMHKAGVVHGDLTTLNMIVVKGSVYLLDFGLAQFSINKEERAVDLDLFFTCLSNQHPSLVNFREFLSSWYRREVGDEVIDHLEKVVEKRGRNKNK